MRGNDSLSGKLQPANQVVNVAKLITAYYSDKPDPSIAAQKVAFGTCGHRGSSLKRSFNEDNELAISQAICL